MEKRSILKRETILLNNDIKIIVSTEASRFRPDLFVTLFFASNPDSSPSAISKSATCETEANTQHDKFVEFAKVLGFSEKKG